MKDAIDPEKNADYKKQVDKEIKMSNFAFFAGFWGVFWTVNIFDSCFIADSYAQWGLATMLKTIVFNFR